MYTSVFQELFHSNCCERVERTSHRRNVRQSDSIRILKELIQISVTIKDPLLTSSMIGIQILYTPNFVIIVHLIVIISM